MPIWASAAAAWMTQRGHLFPWVPVALACGIGLYFSVKTEPNSLVYSGLLTFAFSAIWVSRSLGVAWAPIAIGGALIALGVCLAGLRAHSVSDPVLTWRYYGPIEGRIVGMDRSSSDAQRITLDRVVLRDVAPSRTPGRVRVSLHGPVPGAPLRPGHTVILTGHLSPPGGPVEPGGFDFQRHAWFKGLGAVGYTRTPVLKLAPPDSGQWLFKARMWLSERVRTQLPGDAGTVAAAIMAGDRSAISQEVLKDLRVSNLAHLLAISGLHMGLLAGFVFGTLRLIFAAIPRIGLRWPAKKIAAIGALIVAAGYLALSGGNVATERAFVMVAVMLVAILANRRALSLRSVALAACIILVMRPEALLGPGFQMSFAATTALVAVFNVIRDVETLWVPKWLRPVLAVVMSSLVAGLATAPIAAAHFNQIAHYGLIANLLSVPLMGVLVMPMAVVAALLMPLGLDWMPLAVMRLGLDWILGVAHVVAGLDGARGTVVSPGPEILPVLVLGALFVVLWQGRARVVGAVPMLAAFWMWSNTERPDVLISENGSLVGILTQDGRALSVPKGNGFVAQNWLENDGDAAEQEAAHARWTQIAATEWPITTIRGKKAAQSVTECGPADWLVFNAKPQHDLPCTVIHPGTLSQTGSMALYKDEDGVRTVSARDITGARLWNTRPARFIRLD